MSSPIKLTLVQCGTPGRPRLEVKKQAGRTPTPIAGPKTVGLKAYESMAKGEERDVWAILHPGILVQRVADTEAALNAMIGEADAAERHRRLVAPPAPVPPPAARSRTQGDFHNPYTFVPLMDRPVEAPAGTAPAGVADLLDGKPPLHDRWHANRWHGWFDLELEAVTPLLVPDPESVEQPVRNHDSFDSLQRHGRPCLPASSLKGVVRSAFECATNSRLPQFDTHRRRLGFRRGARSALAVVPVRFERKGEGAWQVRVMGEGGAAWLPRYEADQPGPLPRRALRYPDGGEPRHGDEVDVRVEQRRHRRGFAYESVVGIQPAQRGQAPAAGHIRGWVYVSGQSIKFKHDERVFLDRNSVCRQLSAAEFRSCAELWGDIVQDYRDAHTTKEVWQRPQGDSGKFAAPQDYLGSTPGKTAWGAYVFDEAWTSLDHGTLAWARIRGDDIEALFPAQISRALFSVSPSKCVPESLLPARRHAEFSPADRLFGWVHSERSEAKCTAETAPYRGHVRFGEVEHLAPANGRPEDDIERHGPSGHVLAILGAPKPQQFRFYVGGARGEAVAESIQDERPFGYVEGRRLRGRKIYPHHRAAAAQPGYWKGSKAPLAGGLHREWQRAGDVRDSQNRTMRSWFRVGTRFRVRVHVDNVSLVELGALLWVCQSDAGEVEGSTRHLRLGGGKPLGFGSVRARVVADGIVSGATVKARYQQPTLAPAVSGESDVGAEPSCGARAIAAFLAASEALYPGTPHLAAYRIAAGGFPDALPVHYPRCSKAPDPNGKNYEWFMANEASGSPHALADPPVDRGLPLLDAPQARRRGGD